MSGHDLTFDCPGFRITNCSIDPMRVTVFAEATAPSANCPRCGSESGRVHSRYARTVGDLPCQGRAVRLRLSVRRFTCVRGDCTRKVFGERLPELVTSYARTTGELSETHEAIGFALGGEAGARLAEKLAVPTSPDTLLRRVKAGADDPGPPPRFVGIDDWATKKGQRYGTILIDLERRCVIDILPGRDGEALKQWLRANPQVEVITRDRWAAFAQAAKEAAPQAKQVADRWHLLKNLREAVERMISRFDADIRAAAQAESVPTEPADNVPEEATAKPSPDTLESPAPTADTVDAQQPSVREQARQAKQNTRQERHRLVRELRCQGLTIREIARRVGISIKAVLRYLRQDECPDWQRGRQAPTQLDEFSSFVNDWITQGGRNSAELFRQLRAKGCQASYDAVRRYVNRRLGSSGKPGRRTGEVKPPTPKVPSARKLSFQFIRPSTNAPQSGPTLLDRLRLRIPRLNTALDIASELAAMIRKKVTQPLADWLKKAEQSGIADLANFAASVREDEDAVAAAITDHWNNGPVEGQVNRLKLIKRSMFGKAGFELLRARVKRKT